MTIQDAGGAWALPSFVGVIIGYLLLLVFESTLFRVFLVGFNSGGLIKWWQQHRLPGSVESSQAYLHFSTLSLVAMFATGAILTFFLRDPDFGSTVFMDRYGYNHMSVIFVYAPAAQVAPSFWLVSAYGFLRFTILDAQRLLCEINSNKRNCCLASLVANGLLAMIVVIFAMTFGEGSTGRVLTHEGPYLLLVLIFPIVYALRCWELSFRDKPSCLNVLVSGLWLFVSIVYALALVAARTGSVKADIVRPFDYIWLALAAVCPLATRWPANADVTLVEPPVSEVIVPEDSPEQEPHIKDEGYRVVLVKPATPATADTVEDRDSPEVPSTSDGGASSSDRHSPGSGGAPAFAASPGANLASEVSASPPSGTFNFQDVPASAPMVNLASATHDDNDTRALLNADPPGVVASNVYDDDIETQVLPEADLVPEAIAKQLALRDWPLPDTTAGDRAPPIVGIPLSCGTPQTNATSLAAARLGESSSQALPEAEPPAAACTRRSVVSEASRAETARVETARGASTTNMYNTMDHAAAVVGSAMGHVLNDDVDNRTLPPEDDGLRPEGSVSASGR